MDRGIGAGIAVELGRRGAIVIITYSTDSSREGAQKVAQAIETTKSGGRGVLVQADITSADARRALTDTAVKNSATSQIDILIHNAGNGDDCYLNDITEGFFDQQASVNLKGEFMALSTTI